jgi:hypothetical protein
MNLQKVKNSICEKLVSLDRRDRVRLLSSNRENGRKPPWAGQRVARVGAALPPLLAIPYPSCCSPLAHPPDSGSFPRRALASRRAKPPRARYLHARVMRLQSARSPGVAPKRHGVGRVARRARPDIACHSNTSVPPTPPYPKGGA